MEEKIEILLATYYPNEDFFSSLLLSLENQTYNNIFLRIIDDSNNLDEYNKITSLVQAAIKSFDYSITKNHSNVGSNETFQRLTQLSEAEYIAYCDQDDIWENNKITKLYQKVKEDGSVICYSDLSIIDETGLQTANSFKDISSRLEHKHGDNLFDFFIRRNSITGCTMLIDTSIAKKSLPFPPQDIYVHDHWLAFNSSLYGKISYIAEPLVKYRIHNNNQIGSKRLEGINNKEDYYTKKIMSEQNRVEFLKAKRLDEINQDVKNTILNYKEFVSSRIALYKKKNYRNIVRFMKYCKEDPKFVAFELLVLCLPNHLSNYLIAKSKQN